MVGFVVDPTGASGTCVAEQLALREELREKLPMKAASATWIDILSKVDLPIERSRISPT
jgi:hypothetical protein